MITWRCGVFSSRLLAPAIRFRGPKVLRTQRRLAACQFRSFSGDMTTPSLKPRKSSRARTAFIRIFCFPTRFFQRVFAAFSPEGLENSLRFSLVRSLSTFVGGVSPDRSECRTNRLKTFQSLTLAVRKMANLRPILCERDIGLFSRYLRLFR